MISASPAPTLISSSEPVDIFAMRDCGIATEFHFDVERCGLGRGHASSYEDDDAVISVAEMRLARPIHAEAETIDDVLLIRASSGTACSYSLPNGDSWRFARPGVAVSVLPRGAKVGVELEAGASQAYITMTVRLSKLMDRLGGSHECVPDALKSILDRPAGTSLLLTSMPMSADISALVQDMLHSRLTGTLRCLQAMGRGFELLALVLDSWKAREGDAMRDVVMRNRDAELLAGARRIIALRLVEAPTLKELAHELGTNRNKLHQLFQRSLGVTFKVYFVQRRIERAQALLDEGRLNIRQISESVGYQHQSSFTAAFRGVVGMCPREYGNQRQRHAGSAQVRSSHQPSHARLAASGRSTRALQAIE